VHAFRLLPVGRCEFRPRPHDRSGSSFQPREVLGALLLLTIHVDEAGVARLDRLEVRDGMGSELIRCGNAAALSSQCAPKRRGQCRDNDASRERRRDHPARNDGGSREPRAMLHRLVRARQGRRRDRGGGLRHVPAREEIQGHQVGLVLRNSSGVPDLDVVAVHRKHLGAAQLRPVVERERHRLCRCDSEEQEVDAGRTREDHEVGKGFLFRETVSPCERQGF
jgi:hypothetical protein